MYGNIEKNRKTRKLIGESFAKLYSSKRRESITVKDVCKAAGINRSTFYRHYESIEDLETAITENLMKIIYKEEKIYASTAEDVFDFARNAIIKQLDFMYRNRNFTIPLLGYKDSPLSIRYAQSIRAALEYEIKILKVPYTPVMKYSVSYASAGSVNIVYRWLLKQDISKENLADMLLDQSKTFLLKHS